VGAIEGEGNVSEKQNDKEKLIEKMRTDRDKQNRKTENLDDRSKVRDADATHGTHC
jgi:hypothetical protein